MLEVQNVTKYFGGLRAINGVSFHLMEGEILGLIGPNGAGKTTLFNLVSGVLRPTNGTIVFRGQDITKASIRRTASLGLIRTFQITNLFLNMTVIENVLVGTVGPSRLTLPTAFLELPSERRRRAWASKKAEEVLAFMRISHLRNELARNLPYGHQKMLAVATALAAEPKLLLLDEPFTGMNPVETSQMLDHLRRMRDSGLTFIVVEHNMSAIMAIADRLVVLNFGEKLADGSPSAVREDQAVIDAYLGTEHEDG